MLQLHNCMLQMTIKILSFKMELNGPFINASHPGSKATPHPYSSSTMLHSCDEMLVPLFFVFLVSEVL